MFIDQKSVSLSKFFSIWHPQPLFDMGIFAEKYYILS